MDLKNMYSHFTGDLRRVLSEYKADIYTLQKRLTGEGEIENKSKYQCDIYYSCHPSNHELCMLRIKIKFYHISLICASAPIEGSNESEGIFWFQCASEEGTTLSWYKRPAQSSWWRIPPNGVTSNQIDHVLCDKRISSKMLDVRSMRIMRAEMNIDFHHVRGLLRCRISWLRLTKHLYNASIIGL